MNLSKVPVYHFGWIDWPSLCQWPLFQIQILKCIAYVIGWPATLGQFISRADLSNPFQTELPISVQVAGPSFESKSQGRAYDFHQKLHVFVFFDKKNVSHHKNLKFNVVA